MSPQVLPSADNNNNNNKLLIRVIVSKVLRGPCTEKWDILCVWRLSTRGEEWAKYKLGFIFVVTFDLIISVFAIFEIIFNTLLPVCFIFCYRYPFAQ